MNTYSKCPLSFLSPLELARAGFYDIEPGDRVPRFACGENLSNWEHQKHFPNYPFLENSLGTMKFTVSNLNITNTHSAQMRMLMTGHLVAQFSSSSLYVLVFIMWIATMMSDALVLSVS